MFDSTFRTMRLIVIGVISMAALNILYPLGAWGVGRLRERQATWSPEERFSVSQPGTTEPTGAPQLPRMLGTGVR